MQQVCARQLIFRTGFNAIIRRSSSHASRPIEHEHRDDALICPKWEEAIIKEHRRTDLPFHVMQKQTIDMIHNNKNRIEQQPLLEPITESSF